MYLIKPIDENNDIMIYEFNFTLRDTSILTKSQFKMSKQCVDFNKTNNIYICRDLLGITVLLSVCTYFLTMTVSHSYKYIKGDL